MKKIILLILLFIVTISFGQRILVDDLPMCGHHTRVTYQALWDSLTYAGATVEYTSNLPLSRVDFQT